MSWQFVGGLLGAVLRVVVPIVVDQLTRQGLLEHLDGVPLPEGRPNGHDSKSSGLSSSM